MISLDKYRRIAQKVGGEAEFAILELIKEVERLSSQSDVTNLIGSKEVADMLDIDPKNMHHTRKTKFFPEPETYLGKRPMWRVNQIQEYMVKKEEWRKGSGKS